MASILAIDTSSAWCSVALSLHGHEPIFRHQAVTAGASQLLLPWIEEVLAEAKLDLSLLDAIAVGIGPGAFTGVRLGVAAVQGLAISHDIPVIPVASIDAIAAQVVQTPSFKEHCPRYFVVAIDARMDEIYWSKYELLQEGLPIRLGNIHLSKPEDIDLNDIDYLAGSAVNEFGERLFQGKDLSLEMIPIDAGISVSALGVLDCAMRLYQENRCCDVRELEPLYIRNKVALTTAERLEAFK